MAKAMILRQRWEQLAEPAHYDARELARLCQLSTRQLQREFRRCLGCSPQSWLNEQRIMAAQRLLLTGRSIKETGFELGFKQTSHFCRQFKSLNDLTPSEFILQQTQSSADVAQG